MILPKNEVSETRKYSTSLGYMVDANSMSWILCRNYMNSYILQTSSTHHYTRLKTSTLISIKDPVSTKDPVSLFDGYIMTLTASIKITICHMIYPAQLHGAW